MTDKEQIIIDGCDVSRCRYFLKDTEGQDYETDEFVKGCCEAKGSCIGYEFAGYGLCRGDKDCYFKQLQRKTQECEELKEKYEGVKLENEEVYEIVAALEIDNQECWDIAFLKDENTRYRKALDEIEQYCNHKFCDKFGEITELINKKSILDIINKAKGETNE